MKPPHLPTDKRSVIVTLKWGYIGRRLDAYQSAIEDINEMLGLGITPEYRTKLIEERAWLQSRMDALHNSIESIESPLYIHS